MDYSSFFTNLLQSQDIGASHNTIKNYRADLGQFISWFEKSQKISFSPEKVNSQIISQFQNNTKFHPSTQKRRIASLKKFYSLLALKGYSYSPFTSTNSIPNNISISEVATFLTNSGVSRVTHKNYLSDIRSFLSWTEQVAKIMSPSDQLKPHVIDEYISRLKSNGTPQASINRKLTSLKKLSDYALENKLVSAPLYQSPQQPVTIQPGTISITDLSKLGNSEIEYSNFPPIRLFQRMLRPYFELEDSVATFIAIRLKSGTKKIASKHKSPTNSFITHPHRMTDEDKSRMLHAPISAPRSSSAHFKILHHAKHTRPKWYKNYHSFTATHYLHFGLLIVGTVIVGFALYQNTLGGIFAKTNAQAATAPPPKILAFQGTLSNEKDIAITEPTSVTFNIYSSEFSTDTNSLWQETQLVTPDRSGTFTAYLGTNTPLNTDIFAENNQLFLGIQVGGGQELLPRQRLSSVAYSSNSEFLQGMAPISSIGSGTKNVVLTLNSQGNLVIPDNASTKFQATGGNITLSGQSLILTTNEASNGNVVLAPNGSGQIDLQNSIINSSQNGALWPGSVTIADQAVVTATSSAGPVLAIVQGGTGNILTASSSGLTRFVVDSQGRVGINTSQPTEMLQVNGSIYLQGGGDRIYGESLSLQSTGTSPLLIQPSSLSTNNVGIGSTAPSAFLDVQGGTSSTPLIEFNYTGSGQNILNAQHSGSSVFVLSQTGNIGIGTTTTSSAINLASSISASGGILFGSDTNLYRSGSNTLSTDDSFVVGNDITISGSTTLGGITYTWPGSVGTNGQILATNGNGSLSWVNASQSHFQDVGGSLAPINIASDLLLGGNSTSSALIRLAGLSGENSWINTGGNLGVGTTTPGQALEVEGSIRLDLLEASTTNGVCHSGAPSDTTASNIDLVACSSTPADIAEWYAAEPSVEAGHIVELGTNTYNYNSEGSDPSTGRIVSLGSQEIGVLSKASNVKSAIGIISTGPYKVIGGDIKKSLDDSPEYKAVPLALAGRVLLKIAHNSAPISPGDPITVSSTTPGEGQRADTSTFILAKALESWDKDKEEILVYIQPTWHQAVALEYSNTYQNTTQNNMSVEILQSNIINGIEILVERIEAGSILASEITVTGALTATEIISTRVKAGSIEAINLTASTLEITSNRLTIAGMTIEQYIDSRIQSSQFPDKSEVKLDTISSLSGNEVRIQNSASVQGDLNAESLSTTGALSANSGSISGTLSVERLVAGEIDGLEEKIASISAQNTTPQPDDQLEFITEFESDSNGLMIIPSHKSNFAIFEQGLASYGPATFSQITSTRSIDIGTGSDVLALTDKSLNTLSTLEIQPLAQAGISFLGGEVTIDTSGNIVVNGDTLINGTIAAKTGIFEDLLLATSITIGVISPLPDHDLTVRLGTNEDGSSQNFIISDSSGSAVLAVDNKGNISASGSATLTKLNFWEPEVAYAQVSDIEIETTGSAGKASISAYRRELTIYNPSVTENSLIYVTPSGNTQGKVVSLIRQVPGQSFTVGIQSTSAQEIEFNWLIVN